VADAFHCYCDLIGQRTGVPAARAGARETNCRYELEGFDHLLHARARERVVPISELVFGTLTQNRSSLEPSLGFAAIAGQPCMWIVYHTYKLLKSQSGTRKGCGAPGWTTVPPPVRKLDPQNGNGAWRCDPQDYSGFGLKPQTPTPKSAQLASRAGTLSCQRTAESHHHGNRRVRQHVAEKGIKI
jgi:hypothetical protein